MKKERREGGREGGWVGWKELTSTFEGPDSFIDSFTLYTHRKQETCGESNKSQLPPGKGPLHSREAQELFIPYRLHCGRMLMHAWYEGTYNKHHLHKSSIQGLSPSTNGLAEGYQVQVLHIVTSWRDLQAWELHQAWGNVNHHRPTPEWCNKLAMARIEHLAGFEDRNSVNSS